MKITSTLRLANLFFKLAGYSEDMQEAIQALSHLRSELQAFLATTENLDENQY